MSTPAHNNDELFRQGLEDYREMPPLKVWEGVEAALDQDKKKRRFLLWLWFAGGSGSLAAALLLVPILMGEPAAETNPTARTAMHVAPAVELAMGQHASSALSVDKGTALPGENPSTLADAGTTPTPVNSQKSAVSSPSQRTNIQGKHTANASQPSANQVGAVSHPSRSSKSQGNHTVNASQPGLNPATSTASHTPQTSATLPVTQAETPAQRLPLVPVTLASTQTHEMDITYPFARTHPEDVLTAMGCVAVNAPLLQPTLSIQGYSGGVAYRRGQPTNQGIDEGYKLASTTEQAGKQKKFGVYSGAVIKAGLVIKRHWYVNVGIGYENHSFADRYSFQVPGELYSTGGIDTTTPGLTPPIPTETQYDGFTTNTAFGNAVIPFPPGPAPADITNGVASDVPLSGKLTYQLHQLILPIDFGYRYSFKRLGVYVGGTAAFHVPLAQKALFYADSGPIREVKLAPVAPFNFSVGVEPGVEYNFSKRFSLLAGGTFRYQLLNAHKGGQPSKPYILSGHLGIRVSL